MARKPKEKAEQRKPAILQAIRLGNGDVYGPGEEEEFLEALQAHADQMEEGAEAAQAAGKQPDTFDVKEEIKRLSSLGYLVNFEGADDEDEETDITHDQKARRAVVKDLAAGGGRRGGREDTDELPEKQRVRNRQRQRLEAEEETRSATAPKRKGAKAAEADEEGAGGKAEE
jgi:hypothetical protein